MIEKHIRKVTLKTGVFYDVRFCVNYKDIKEGRFNTLEKAIKHRNSVYPKYGKLKTTTNNISDEKLTQSILKNIVHYNAATGKFTRIINSGNGKIGDTLGGLHKRTGYIIVSVLGQQLRAHRLAYLYMEGYMPKNIDHINGDKTDNIWTNLRDVSASENSRNQPTRITSKFKIMGVSKDKNGWKAYIQDNTNHTKYVYCGPDFFEACCKRKAAERYYNYHINHGR